MSPEERIGALERELTDTRIASTRLILRIVEGLATTPAAREGLARSIEEAAAHEDAVTARLVRLVAAGLRQ